jgi:hypothetical protein
MGISVTPLCTFGWNKRATSFILARGYGDTFLNPRVSRPLHQSVWSAPCTMCSLWAPLSTRKGKQSQVGEEQRQEDPATHLGGRRGHFVPILGRKAPPP